MNRIILKTKIFLVFVCVSTIFFSTSVFAFNTENNEMTDVDSFNSETIDLEATLQNNEETTIYFDNGMRFVLSPINQRERLYSYRWLDLTRDVYKHILTDRPLVKTNLKVNNYRSNPGAIKMCVTIGDQDHILTVPVNATGTLTGIPAGSYSISVNAEVTGSYELCFFDW